MTQNPYQQGPPPGYGQPQAPPGYDPQTGQAWPTPQAPPQAPSPFTQPGQAGPPLAGAGGDGFGVPDSRPAAGDQPAVHQLAASNRLVLIKVLRWNTGGKKFNSDEPEEQMFVDMIVCDGPPIEGSQDFNTKVVTPFAGGPKHVPFFIGQVIINKAVMDRCRSALTDPTLPKVVLGRLVTLPPKGGKGFPWNNLAEPTEEDKVIARPIFAAWDQIEQAAAVTAPPVQPQGYAQAPGQPYQGQFAQPPAQPHYQQGPPPGYPTQNPYGAPPQAPPGWNGQPPY